MIKLLQLTCISTFLFLFVPQLFAQDAHYTTFFITGAPKVIVGQDTADLKIDEMLSPEAILVVPQNCYVVILNENEIPVGISKEGTYTTEDIATVFNELDDSDLSSEFFDYVSENMIEESDVERRSGGVYRAANLLMDLPFDSAIVITKDLPFKWKNPTLREMYLKVYDISTWDIVYNIPTSDTVHLIKNITSRLETGKNYAWMIYPSKNDPSPEEDIELFTFIIPTRQEKGRYYDEIKMIEAQTSNKNVQRIKTIRLFLNNSLYPVPYM